MSKQTITIAGTEYPIKFGHSALVKMLQLAKMTKYTEIEKLIQDFPAEEAPTGVLALVENGLKVEGSKLKPPTLEEIQTEMDKDVLFWLDVLNKLGEELAPPEPVVEGNSATKTSEA